MKGWKTWLGAGLVAIGGVLEGMPEMFPGQEAVAKALLAIGAAIGAVGLGHKIEKSGSGSGA